MHNETLDPSDIAFLAGAIIFFLLLSSIFEKAKPGGPQTT